MLRFCVIVVLALTLCAPAVAQNLVVNGDFEDPYYGDPYTGMPPGPYFYGWNVDGDSVDVIGSYWQAASGLQSIDLNGNHPGAMWQDISNSAATKYSLSFAIAANPDLAGVKTMEVWWGGAKLDTLRFDSTGHSRTDMGWSYHTYVVNGSGLDRLSFVSTSADNCYGAALDNVSLTAVPEPSSLLALVGGLGLLAPVLCKRRR